MWTYHLCPGAQGLTCVQLWMPPAGPGPVGEPLSCQGAPRHGLLPMALGGQVPPQPASAPNGKPPLSSSYVIM